MRLLPPFFALATGLLAGLLYVYSQQVPLSDCCVTLFEKHPVAAKVYITMRRQRAGALALTHNC